jgi:hypothetical protein
MRRLYKRFNVLGKVYEPLYITIRDHQSFEEYYSAAPPLVIIYPNKFTGEKKLEEAV